MSDIILYEVRDRIAHIQINRPKSMNAINYEVMKELSARLKQADEDDANVSVVVLSGSGANFSAGYDLKIDWYEKHGENVLGMRKMMLEYEEFEFGPWECTKPVIAMVRGYCLAGACELAMMSCITFSSDTAQLGEPEIRFSTSPPVLVIPWLVGLKKSRELLYSGDIIDAYEAEKIGMVNRVIPDSQLEEETFRYARRVAAVSLEALRTTKSSINKGAEIAGIRHAISYAMEQGAMLDATVTEAQSTFNKLIKTEGLSAAIRWRESHFEDVPG
jgi:enoyl-CoA hydratase